jgi:hypothetical protein
VLQRKLLPTCHDHQQCGTAFDLSRAEFASGIKRAEEPYPKVRLAG